jgi:peptidoglycan/LPS O-acetylase OafA/YrhL
MPEPAVEAVVTAPSSADVPPARVYFPELDGLRTIAFLGVFAFHHGVPEGVIVHTIGRTASVALVDNGWVGVQLFFILSGYLITTLLLTEESRFGRIALRAFWVRRACRIWPLYFLALVIGFVLLPWGEGRLGTADFHNTISRHLVPFLLFLGNWSLAYRGMAMNLQIGVLWSVCVEEQFYLVVPLLIAWVPARFRVPAVVVLMAASIALRAYLATVCRVPQIMIQFNTFTQFDTLLGGVLLALLLGTDPKGRASWVGRWARWLQWPLYGFIAWGLCQPHLAQDVPHKQICDFIAIWACGAGVIVVAVTVRGRLQAILSSTILVWLGKISYGLYMYHEVAMWFRPRLIYRLGWFPNQAELMSFVTLAITIAMAAVSYYAFERPFLKLKKGWSRLPSRPV